MKKPQIRFHCFVETERSSDFKKANFSSKIRRRWDQLKKQKEGIFDPKTITNETIQNGEQAEQAEQEKR